MSRESSLLSESDTFNEFKISKIRTQYYNKDNLCLGTDLLTKKTIQQYEQLIVISEFK